MQGKRNTDREVGQGSREDAATKGELWYHLLRWLMSLTPLRKTQTIREAPHPEGPIPSSKNARCPTALTHWLKAALAVLITLAFLPTTETLTARQSPQTQTDVNS